MEMSTSWLSGASQWPLWASCTCFALCLWLVSLHIVEKLVVARKSVQKATDCAHAEAFALFQRQYLLVYGLVMFADWLQGTHMYSLYQSYGLNVGTLFLTGFLSSVVFGYFIGPLVDKFGRRRACLVYCVLEIIINLLEDVPNMKVLLAGRVMGGVSTSLLFSAFESWMVTEHRARGFPEELLGKTFALGSEINGVVAVVAGLVAQVVSDAFGDIGPFRAAVGMTAVAAAFVFSWTENYGSATEGDVSKSAKCKLEAETTDNMSSAAYALGLSYSLFEGAMYVFVFLWYPTLEVVVPNGILPSGLVFSSFMLCTAIGGKIVDLIGSSWLREELMLVGMVATSAISLLIPTATEEYHLIFGGFLAFEVCVGAISPCCATLRSRYFPKARLSTTLSLFRVPTNVLVVLGTGGENYLTSNQLYCGCSAVLVLATACAVKLVQTSSTTPGKKLKAQ